ncbi:MAG: hypothetical protein M5U25_16465 [Planctomycetota bacterium]|nr:hypothetical protein [Planctomycetota bacterium]
MGWPWEFDLVQGHPDFFLREHDFGHQELEELLALLGRAFLVGEGERVEGCLDGGLVHALGGNRCEVFLRFPDFFREFSLLAFKLSKALRH